MSRLSLFVLLCTLFVSTKSSAIGEAPEIEKSPLPEINDENKNVDDLIQLDESKLVVRVENATSSELASSYCSQFDNSCVKCLKRNNCTMARYTKEIREDKNVQEMKYELKCFDINATIKEIKQAFEDQKYDIIQNDSDCPKASRKEPNQENITEKKSQSFVKPSSTESIAPSNDTTIKSTTSDNTTTNATTETPTTSQTTVTTTTDATTANTSTTQTTPTGTNSTASNPTSATNSTQIPITSKNPPPPASNGGWSFWSFFGGILLTLGLSAIGFVGFKYYKARSGTPGGGLNYNRF